MTAMGTPTSGLEVPPGPTMRAPIIDSTSTTFATSTAPIIALGGDIRGTSPVIFGQAQTLAQSTLAQQVASGNLTQAAQTFQAAIPQLTTGQSIGIGVPADSPAAQTLMSKAAQANALLAQGRTMAEVNRIVYGF